MSKLLKDNKKKLNSLAGFSLVEMVVVVSIIVILMAMLIPALAYMLGKGRNMVAKETVNNIMTSIRQYETEVGKYPESDPASSSYQSGSGMLFRSLTGKTRRRGMVFGPFIDENTENQTYSSDKAFIDYFGNPILYYKAKISQMSGTTLTKPNELWGDQTSAGGGVLYKFDTSHNQFLIDTVKNGTPMPTSPSDVDNSNVWPASVILISAGLDKNYGTEDDIVVTE